MSSILITNTSRDVIYLLINAIYIHYITEYNKSKPSAYCIIVRNVQERDWTWYF